MPIYEYRCGRCEGVFEVFVRGSSDGSPPRCTECGSRKVEKVFSVFASHGTASRASSAASCAGCSTHNCATCGH
ncbi:MAG: FmdB family zinc ribbon protein [Planctomycetota bacterium]